MAERVLIEETVTVTRTPIGVEEGIELQEHDEYEGEEDQEGSQEKKSSNRGEMLKKGARMGGKALGAGYTAVNQARKTAAKAAVVGVGRAAESGWKNVKDEHKEWAKEKIQVTKTHAEKGVKVVAEYGKEVAAGAIEGKQYTETKTKILYEKLPEQHRQFIEEQKQWLESKTELSKAYALGMSQPMIDKIFELAHEQLKKNLTSDPYMFNWVKRSIHRAVDDIWPDIKEELTHNLTKAARKTAKQTVEQDNGCCFPKNIRAWVLYHYLPYNKGFFEKLHDPGFIFLKLFTLIPIFGVRTGFFLVLLIFHATGNPPDEFQLIRYIQTFKSMQFFTGGIISGLMGAIQYYLCVNFAAMSLKHNVSEAHTCHEMGPGTAGEFLIEFVGFVMQIVLVWIAFLLLPYSEKKGEFKFQYLTEEEKKAIEDHKREQEMVSGCCSFVAKQDRGGRLRKLMRYDFYCFLFCFLLFVGMLFGVQTSSPYWSSLSTTDYFNEWQFKSSLFWVKIIYALLSFPFFLFEIPILKSIFTHARETGYSRSGLCVPLSKPDAHEIKDSEV